MSKNRHNMTTMEYMNYIPEELSNGFLNQEDLPRETVNRWSSMDKDSIYTSLIVCAGYLLDIIANNPGKYLHLTRYGHNGGDCPEIYYEDKENDDEYATRLRDLATMREYAKKDKLKRLKEKEYQEELANLNKKYGKS